MPLRTALTPATRFGDAISWALRGLGVVVVAAGMAGAARERVPSGTGPVTAGP